jgi:hypothetical protein
MLLREGRGKERGRSRPAVYTATVHNPPAGWNPPAASTQRLVVGSRFVLPDAESTVLVENLALGGAAQREKWKAAESEKATRQRIAS